MAKQKMLKTPLFDRIFKPELITLPNGHTVERPRSRTPLILLLFTIGIVAKMLYESIETIDMGPYEAMQSFGASTLQSFWAACMPQILPTYLADCLYCFEINVRASSILGYVGAGGLGILIRERTGLRAYSDLGMILITLFVVVWLIDMINDYLRSKLS